MCDTLDDNQIDANITPSTKLLDDTFTDDQQKCHFVDNNLDKIYYHAHPLVNRTNCSMNPLNNSAFSNSLNPLSSLNPLNSTLPNNDCQTREPNSPTLCQLTSLINSTNSKDATLNNLKLNQANSIPTINYAFNSSSNSNIPTCLPAATLNSPNQRSTTLTAISPTTKSLNDKAVYQDFVELQSSSVQLQQQAKHDTFSHSKNEFQFKSSLSSCSGSCNQLIHGYQMPKGQQTLLNNNIYSNQNRNSFAAISSTNGGYLNHLNRFNLLRNSMRSTNEFSNTVPSSIYGQFTIASLRNSLAWSPVYWSSGVNNNNFHTLNNVKNLNNVNGSIINGNNVLNGTLNNKLNGQFFKNGLPVCSSATTSTNHQDSKRLNSPTTRPISQCRQLSSSLDQTDRIEEKKQMTSQANSNHETNLDSNFSNLCNRANDDNLDSKQDQSIEADKISLYDNVDDDDESLQPLLEKSKKLIQTNLLEHHSAQQPVRSSNSRVRIVENCRDDIQHLSLNKLCL